MNEIGKKGENYVSEYLKKMGFKIIYRNYHSRYGEIDIICEDEKYIVFVEVKLRKKNSLIRGTEAVSKSKRIKIIKTALVYFINNTCEKQPRFDVAEIISDKKEDDLILNYLENAFDTEELNAFF